MNEIGSKLKILRKEKKLTQQELAEKIGITRATVSNYEIGRRTPNIDDLTRFARFYGVGLDYFDIITKDTIFSIICEAKNVFGSEEIPKVKKDQLYKELMKLYLSIK